MAPTGKEEVIINGHIFYDATNQTVSGRVYNYEEALALTLGRHIITFYNTSKTYLSSSPSSKRRR